jgi:excisionase family DNA binding protein
MGRTKRPNSELQERNTWTPRMAAEWAGVPLRTLYRLLREGVLPCIRVGDSQVQRWPNAHNGKRKRACFKYLIPRQAFIKAWENLGNARDRNTAA